MSNIEIGSTPTVSSYQLWEPKTPKSRDGHKYVMVLVDDIPQHHKLRYKGCIIEITQLTIRKFVPSGAINLVEFGVKFTAPPF